MAANDDTAAKALMGIVLFLPGGIASGGERLRALLARKGEGDPA